ncbi:MAG: Unknown protein [uncultured Sulfurovum sp.]|uniref:Uncharacterized protein n=1 Tax=uncultured Sulfurovum sp. TaxID=269237 RepID=A0A6S6SU39_9BACT|nr:MAG: Unknown protein [uncultured Sulfurovum sp.]
MSVKFLRCTTEKFYFHNNHKNKTAEAIVILGVDFHKEVTEEKIISITDFSYASKEFVFDRNDFVRCLA